MWFGSLSFKNSFQTNVSHLPPRCLDAGCFDAHLGRRFWVESLQPAALPSPLPKPPSSQPETLVLLGTLRGMDFLCTLWPSCAQLRSQSRPPSPRFTQTKPSSMPFLFRPFRSPSLLLFPAYNCLLHSMRRITRRSSRRVSLFLFLLFHSSSPVFISLSLSLSHSLPISFVLSPPIYSSLPPSPFHSLFCEE